MQEPFKIRGHVQVTVRDQAGCILERHEVKNLVVTAGRDLIASRLKNATAAALSHFAVGTGTATPAPGNTTLGTEVYRDAITSFTLSAGTGTWEIQYFLPDTQANGNTLTEAGVFNAASSGTMFCRAVYPPISKTSDKSVTYVWTFTLTAS